MTMQPISVILPVSQAIDRVRRVLFRPFDAAKWFTIGFCAWLAHLGERGGGSFNFHLPGGGDRDLRHEFDRAREFVLNNLYWLVPAAVALVVAGLVVWVLFMWLSSRGKFMFLHCVALNQADVAGPWNRFAREGNSLFRFRLGFGLIGLMVMLPLAALAVILVLRMIIPRDWTVAGVLGLLGLGLLIIGVGIVLAIIRKLTMDFVVPIMFLRGKRCLESWSEFLNLLGANPGPFVLYLLFQLVLRLATGMLVLTIVIMTCCLAGCLLVIPYLGTVFLLPVLVFHRAYSLHFLAQCGREYAVFPPDPP